MQQPLPALQDNRSISTETDINSHLVAETLASSNENPAEMISLSPSKAAHELVRKAMLACFMDCSSSERSQLLQDVQTLSRQFAKHLFLPTNESSREEDENQSQYVLPREQVAPPSAFYCFHHNSRMYLPIIDWSAFRGFSVAMWINVDFYRPRTKKDEDLCAKFYLFRFTNGSNTLGIEASVEFTDNSSDNMLLNFSCGAAGTGIESKKSASIATSSLKTLEWRRIQHKVKLRRNRWHLLVLSHSLHYVKKSKVTCYVDKKLQFTDELVYPSGLVTASKCTIGGGRNASAKVASVTMYQEEMPRDTIELIYGLGPSVSSFNRWTAVPAPSNRTVASTVLGQSSLRIPENEAFTAFWKLQVVFAFNAQNVVNEDYADLGVEWLCEGTSPKQNGKWLTLETTLGISSEIQQRTARLGKNTQKKIFADFSAAWYRCAGISSLPVLLDYVCTAYEKTIRASNSSEMTTTRPLSAVLESLVVDFLWICKGILLSSVNNQQEVVRNYVFHLFSHVLVKHSRCLSVIWTPGSLVVCVEMVKSLAQLMPMSKRSSNVGENHPIHPSIWATNPLFSAGVRALLLDYRLWSHADYKTQSIYNHQLYGLACEYPRAFNNLRAVTKVLEILNVFYSTSSSSHSSNDTKLSQNSHQLTALNDTNHHWKQQCIQTLVEVIEVCLTNQSTHVHEVLEQELMETTFARASNSAGNGTTGAPGSGSAPSASPAASSSSSSPSADRKGGVFSINLECITWSDQAGNSVDTEEKGSKMSVLHSIQVRFSLVRDIRAVIRFLLTSKDAAVCTSLLLLLRRLAVSFRDMRFALISSCVMDCLLYLMQDRRTDADRTTHSHLSIHVRMACVPLFIYLLDWLESIEGRTVWCGLEEHLRLVLNGHSNFSVGFLELMVEFYFDPAWLLGVQHSIIMNDPSKKDSLLFPIASSASTKVLVSKEKGRHDGIAVEMSPDTGEPNSGIGGLMEWIKLTAPFTGKRLQLTWEKRASVIRLMALRNLSNVGEQSPAIIAESFDEGVSGILSLPLTGILPFLPILLGNGTPHFREKVLMDINVKLKTDEDVQQLVLSMNKRWAEALLELSLTCSIGVETVRDCSQEELDGCGRAYSIDASKTGEDLVLDTIVSLLCMAMENSRGWSSFTHLLVALRNIQLKYESEFSASTLSSLPPLTQVSSFVHKSEIFCQPFNWLCRVVGIVLQRMARSRTILSRTLAENIQRVLFLVHETLLTLPVVGSDKYAWSDAQLFLLNSVLEVCTRLVQSTHKLHRVGLCPGLEILQCALPYVTAKTMMERVVNLLVQIFQQELTVGAALRVYESMPTRDVFLHALVDLRRALVIHKKEELLSLLRGLTLRICTSGSFDGELDGAGLSSYELSALTEQKAVEVVLDTLALAINDKESHEREDEGDRVPYFPVARELRTLQPDTRYQSHKCSSAESKDESERVLWAALEVEENRMLATLRDVTSREMQRVLTTTSVQRDQKFKWTQELWMKHEFIFRSQHEYDAFKHKAPATLEILQKTHVWRLGAYESPFPSRVRRTLDVDLYLSAEKMLTMQSSGRDDVEEVEPAVLKPRQPSGSVVSLEKMSYCLEMGDNVDDACISNEVIGGSLLERVGRVVAQQRGGEIQDITTDDAQFVDTYVPITDAEDKETEAQNEPLDDLLDEYKLDTIPTVNMETNGANMSTNASAGSSIKGMAFSGQEDEGLDPGAGIAVAPGDRVYASITCRRVVPEGIVQGRLSLCTRHIVFEPQPDRSEQTVPRDSITNFDDTTLSAWSNSSVDEVAPGLHRCWRWKYRHLVGVYLRRYRLRDSAIELFLRSGISHFLDFPRTTKHRRNEFVRVLYSFLPRSTPKQWPGQVIPHLAATTKAWQNGQISNFDYLMALNTYAGRSFNDLTQYPVFPWVLSNYHDATLDLSDSQNFRDLSKPVGALNASRLDEYWERYHSFDDPVIPKFLYGSHYSTCAGVVLFFLFRVEPFATLHQKMQGGTFDLPDRLFFCMEETWRMCNSHMSEVKELTPEFYASDGTFLRNGNRYALGKRHDDKAVDDVQLPPWAATPEDFIRIHRAALESEYVSSHLHLWIDLIFGNKQRGRASLEANNVFYYLTYYGVVDLDKVDDPFLRESMELQIAHFGQCPMQLFATPHPKRLTSIRRSAGAPAAPVSERQSPTASDGNLSGLSSSVPRPLSVAFQDFSLIAQERRRHWSPLASVKPIAQSGIRLLKILPDRVVSINELGVVEVYYWKLLSKPVSPSSSIVGSLSPHVKTIASDFSDSTDVSRNSFSSVTSLPRESEEETLLSDLAVCEDNGEKFLTECPWLLEIVRDDSPFDYVPRIPVFDLVASDRHNHLNQRSCGFPVVMTGNGRVVVSGGARNGALHFRLLDLDNGHVIGKASVVGHSAAVTCLSRDRANSHGPHYIGVSSVHEDDEVVVSGSQDGTLALWRLSRLKPDLLFRLPRVSPCPIQLFRGHATRLVDCCVSTYLNLIVSCTQDVGMVHYIHEEGQVAFVFRPAESNGEFVRVCLSIKGYILAITSVKQSQNEERPLVSSIYQLFSMSGVLIQTHYLSGEEIVDIQVAAEGDLVFLTLVSGIIRICRIEDFVTVQEYISPTSNGSMISATCFGPKEAVILLASGHKDGTLSLQLLPDASGSVSFLTNVRRLFGVSSKLKRVKGTVQHAQTLAMSTLDNAKAVTNTARDIAGEAIGEAKVMMRGLISYLQKG
ncbi:putative BEACH domain, concanavalin A-like lectin/glucanase domain superfamily, PH-BEACH [Plasmopara halstedii]